MTLRLKIVGLFIAVLGLAAGITVFTTGCSSNATTPFQDGLEPALPLVEPVTKDIFAELGWQSTGILLASGESIHIQFVSGEIRDGDTIIRGPSGVGWACEDRDCCEPMPDVGRDALIGRVGDELFLIGDRNEISVATDGELQLRINDCDAGLFDNSGSLRIKISP